MRILIPISDGVNATEVVTLVEILRRAGLSAMSHSCVVAYIGESDFRGGIESSQSLMLIPNRALDDVTTREEWDAVLIPGGSRSTETLIKSPLVLQLVAACHQMGNLVAAMCSGPLVLAEAGIVKRGETVTSGIAARHRLENEFGLTWIDQPVVEFGHIVTAQGPGASIPFAFTIVKRLFGLDPIRRMEDVLNARAAIGGLRRFEELLT